jgi:hypothetical protein
MDEKVALYLKEIAEVSKQHGLFIESCDCCTKIRDANGVEVEYDGYGIGYDEEKDSY